MTTFELTLVVLFFSIALASAFLIGAGMGFKLGVNQTLKVIEEEDNIRIQEFAKEAFKMRKTGA